jgi:asparaginyl-tRNA synthetase
MTSEAATPSVPELHEHVDANVELVGWLARKRSSGKIAFLQIRDGLGVVQAVVSRAEVSEQAWEETQQATQESVLLIRGLVKEDARSPSGVEIQASDVELRATAEEFPITPKDHGVAFLMEHRHLWLRSSRQRAALRIRSEVCRSIRDFFHDRDFVLIDSPILTPAACEGTSTLFETDYFGDQAYLTQSGQLYLEPAAAAFGRVYCFGPTFRAEKSKTRRHLTEFWMVEPEVAFLEFDGLQDLAEDFICHLVQRVLERCQVDLDVLERDVEELEKITKPFPRIRYAEALEILAGKSLLVEWGDDFGADEETVLAEHFDKPVMVTNYPIETKAFYMQPDPEEPGTALALDVLAPQGYGEIIGGSQRIHDYDLLLSRIREHDLPLEAFQWYLDVRRYGTFPHSGFGMGIERFVAWVTGLKHLRETIPYPRLLHKIYP